jgi:hypothetical protein
VVTVQLGILGTDARELSQVIRRGPWRAGEKIFAVQVCWKVGRGQIFWAAKCGLDSWVARSVTPPPAVMVRWSRTTRPFGRMDLDFLRLRSGTFALSEEHCRSVGDRG